MGSGRYSPDDWATYAATTKNKTAEEVYLAKKLNASLDPRKIKIRESRDSEMNQQSTAVIIALDQTGSMNAVLEDIVQKDLGVAFSEIYDRHPISDPHVMIMTFDDVNVEGAGCLQVSQFEAEVRPLTDQISKFWLTNNGGGNNSESYHLPLYFAATKTSIDCFEKRGKKGYIFTIGDEETPPKLTREQIKVVLGDKVESDFSYEDCLRMAERMYHVFHIMVAEGHHFHYRGSQVKDSWRKVLGERALLLTDHTKLGEVIVSAIQLNEGADLTDVLDSWSSSTALVVRDAVKGITKPHSSGSTDTLVAL